MTYEEAVELLDVIRFEIEDVFNEDVIEAYDMAIASLQKNLKINPDIYKDGMITYYLCPDCGRELSYNLFDDVFGTQYRHLFCPRCGRAIDWSNV